MLGPQTAFIANTAGLLLAIGCHTLALHQLSDRRRSGAWHLRLLLMPVLVYGLGASVLLHSSYMLSWFFLFCVLTIGVQFWVTWPLRTRFRGAWALLAGHLALLVFHADNAVSLAINPPPALSFDEPDMFSLPALAMDFMVSFLFTLSFALTVCRLMRKDDVFVRWGGEEFLLVFPGTNADQAQGFLARLREALGDTPGLPFVLGFSAGLAQSSAMNSREDFETLLRSVDKALYRAKRVRGRVEVVEAVDL